MYGYFLEEAKKIKDDEENGNILRIIVVSFSLISLHVFCQLVR